MYFMNEWEVQAAAQRYAHHPVLGRATRFLMEFMQEVNQHSDGWAYWKQPVTSAKQLMTLIESARENPEAATEAAFSKSLTPIRSFYTRRGNAVGMTMPEVL